MARAKKGGSVKVPSGQLLKRSAKTRSTTTMGDYFGKSGGATTLPKKGGKVRSGGKGRGGGGGGGGSS